MTLWNPSKRARSSTILREPTPVTCLRSQGEKWSTQLSFTVERYWKVSVSTMECSDRKPLMQRAGAQHGIQEQLVDIRVTQPWSKTPPAWRTEWQWLQGFMSRRALWSLQGPVTYERALCTMLCILWPLSTDLPLLFLCVCTRARERERERVNLAPFKNLEDKTLCSLLCFPFSIKLP